MRIRILFVCCLLALASCGTDKAPGEAELGDIRGKFTETEVTVDGRILKCVHHHQGYTGGLSCNWEAWNTTQGEDS